MYMTGSRNCDTSVMKLPSSRYVRSPAVSPHRSSRSPGMASRVFRKMSRCREMSPMVRSARALRLDPLAVGVLLPPGQFVVRAQVHQRGGHANEPGIALRDLIARPVQPLGNLIGD